MNRIFRTLMAAVMVFSMAACSDDDHDHRPDTTSGATRHEETPDTTSGATTPAEGSIVKGRIGVGSITIDGQTFTDVFGIDFNKDGILEFRIVNDGTSLQCQPTNADGILVRGVAVSGGTIATLQKHATIGPSLNYSTTAFASLPALASLPEKFYVAFRLDFGGTCYGWAKVKYKNGSLEWDKCAYCTTPNATLTAGDD
jgi:hypothetical protein